MQRQDIGVDARLEDRPGVPKERIPTPIELEEGVVAQQRVTVSIQVSADRPSITPVFGTAVPPKGLSGVLRRLAYRIPEHHARRWMLLLLADRVDVIESSTVDLARRRPFAVMFGVAAIVSMAMLLPQLRRRD